MGRVLLLIAACGLCVGGFAFYIAYWRWYFPRRLRLKLQRLRSEEAAGVPPGPRDYHYAISFAAAGFAFADLRGRDSKTFAMRWEDVSGATAFKRDFGSVDCICLFLAGADGMGVELDEEMARWTSFVEALPEHLPGCNRWAEWFQIVAFPPFATSETEIYSRGATQSSESFKDAN